MVQHGLRTRRTEDLVGGIAEGSSPSCWRRLEAIGPLHGEAARACERAPGQLARKLGLCGGCCCVRAHRIHLLPEPRGSPRQSSSRTPICAWHVRWARIARVCEPWGAPWLARLRRGAGAFTRRHGTIFKWEAVRSLF